jgi:hypothetical protein
MPAKEPSLKGKIYMYQRLDNTSSALSHTPDTRSIFFTAASWILPLETLGPITKMNFFQLCDALVSLYLDLV